MVKPSMRVVMFKRPDLLIDLSERIIKKHENDGVNSLLNVVDMVAMKSQTVAARAANNVVQECNAGKAVAFGELRRLLGITTNISGTVDYYVKCSRNILLGVYKGMEHKLGDHNFTVNKSNGGIKIIIPTNSAKLIELAGLILAKHNEDVVNSPIKGLNIADFTAKYNEAKTQYDLAMKMNRDKETAIGERNRILGLGKDQKLTSEPTVRYFVTVVRDVLLGLFRGVEHELGSWGFDVNHGVHKKAVVVDEPANCAGIK